MKVKLGDDDETFQPDDSSFVHVTSLKARTTQSCSWSSVNCEAGSDEEKVGHGGEGNEVMQPRDRCTT